MNAWPPSIPQELRDAPQQALQEYTMTYAREFLKTACRHLSVSDEAFLDHFDQLLASTAGFLRPSTISTADPAQTFTRRGVLKFVHDCLYNSCSAGNRCSFCALNPKRRCAQGCDVAFKQTEFEAMEAPCEAPLKVALHAIEADNAQSSSAVLDLADIFLEFSLLNGSLHDSYCQDLGACDDLALEQLRRCEVLTYTSKEGDDDQLLGTKSSLEVPSEGHRVQLKFAPGADSILPDLRVMKNSNKRIGPKNPDYKLLAHAIDTSTGQILAQAVSRKFSVTTSRSQANRKAAIPCWTDDVKYLEKCGAEKCKGLADLVAHAGVDNVPEDCIKKVTTVRQFQELVEYVKHWPECPFKSLLPTEAIAHAATALGPDSQMRVWQSPDRLKGLMYTCQQAQIDWGPKNPAVVCHWCAVLMEYEPEQGAVRLTLASDLTRYQKALVSSLATAASEQWQQELHPGWSMAAADSELLLDQILQELQRVGGRSLDLSGDAYARLLNQVPSAPVTSSAAAAPKYPIPAEVPPQASMQHCSPPAVFSLPPVQSLGQPEPEMPSWPDLQGPMPSNEPMMVHHTPMDSHPVAPFTAAAAPHSIHNPCLQQTPQPVAHGSAGYLAQGFMPQRLGQSGQGYQQAPHGYGQVAHGVWQMPQGRAQQPQGYQGLPLGVEQPLQCWEEVSQGFRRPLHSDEQVVQGHEQQGCRELPQGGELMPQGLSEDGVTPDRLGRLYAQMHSQSCSRVHPRGFDRTPSFTDEQRAKRRNTAPASQLEDMFNEWDSGLPADQGNLRMQQDVLQLAEAATAAGQAFDSSSHELSLSTHIVLPMAAGQPSSLSTQFERPTQLHLHLSASAASFATPYSHQQQPSNDLDFPWDSDMSGWLSEGMTEVFLADCLASAQTTQQRSVHEAGAGASSGEKQLVVIEPAVQHVVLFLAISFLAKMRALVARRRTQRGDTTSLSLHLDQRQRLCLYVATCTR